MAFSGKPFSGGVSVLEIVKRQRATKIAFADLLAREAVEGGSRNRSGSRRRRKNRRFSYPLIASGQARVVIILSCRHLASRLLGCLVNTDHFANYFCGAA